MSSRCIAWLALLALAAASLSAAAPPKPTWPLDLAGRNRLDALALAQKPPTFAEERINLAGTVPAFLLTRLQLPAEVELTRSRDAHDDMLKRERTRPTPGFAARALYRLAKELPTYQKPPDLRFAL